MNKRHARWAGALGMGLLTLSGCGGGGGSSSTPSNPGGSSTMAVYVTDDFSADYSQVWVTLYKIEAGDGTTFRTVYAEPTGATVNVKALGSVSQLLNSISVPAGNYTQARVTFGDHVTLVPTGGGAGRSVPVDDSIGTHSAGQVQITLNAPVRAEPGRLSNLVVDFDLAAFQLVGGRLRPVLHPADPGKFGRDRKHGAFNGVVSNLKPGVGFDLSGRNGKTIAVLLTDKTVIVNRQQGADAALANGQRVEVSGPVAASGDGTGHTLTAETIKIKPREGGEGEDGDKTGALEGVVASVNADAKTFVVTLKEAEHFQPTGGTATVKTDAKTVYGRPRHQPGSFADIAVGGKVVAIGTFDAATQTLTARRIQFKEHGGDDD